MKHCVDGIFNINGFVVSGIKFVNSFSVSVTLVTINKVYSQKLFFPHVKLNPQKSVHGSFLAPWKPLILEMFVSTSTVRDALN